MRTCKAIWEHLQIKYKDKRLATGLVILRDLINYTFDGRITDAWNDINNKRRHLKEINPEVVKAFSENQIFQILLNSLSKVYTLLTDELMTSHEAINEKLQKLMDKEDTLTKIESAMTAYRKIFKVFCFLCDDDAHLVVKCPYLLKAQVYIKEKVVKARSTSRNRKKSRRYYHNSSDFEVSITLLESIDSEVEKKKKKKSEKKPDKKDKKKGYAYAAVSDSDSDDYNTYSMKAYGAISDESDDDGDIHAYIAIAKNQGFLNELLKEARVMNEIAGLWQDYYQQKGTQLGGVIAKQGEQLNRVAKQREQLDQGQQLD